VTIIRVVDLETTGIEPPQAEVCEVGYCDLHLEERRIDDPKSWLCSVKAIPPEARAVHHISMAECASFPSFQPTAVVGQDIAAVAAHNSEFECRFITPTVPVICTYKASLRAWPDAPSHSNGALRYWLEDQGKIAPVHTMTQPAHRAGPDSYTTAHILLALFNSGLTGREMASWTKEPALLPKCPIGKFRGMPWSEVEGGFLGWMTRQPTMEADLKWNAEREIARRQGANS
jgi:exodeoxyribonuclease X